jgi:hypothetical protein
MRQWIAEQDQHTKTNREDFPALGLKKLSLLVHPPQDRRENADTNYAAKQVPIFFEELHFLAL